RHVPLGRGVALRLQRPLFIRARGNAAKPVVTLFSEEGFMVSPASRFLSLAALVGLLVGAPGMAHAQNGRIRGVVRDSHASPLAGAVVRASGPGPARRATTSEDGSYSLTGLAAGTYTLSASLPGVRTQQKTGVQVAADAEAQVDFVMTALELEAVTVTAMKREEQLIDVPLSIAAPTEQALRIRGVENIEEVAQNVAGFSVQNLGPGQSQPELGVSKPFGEAGVTAIDGGDPGSTAKLGFNVPMGDKAAARLVGYSSRTGGWMDAVQPDLTVNHNVNGSMRAGLRAALRLEP